MIDKKNVGFRCGTELFRTERATQWSYCRFRKSERQKWRWFPLWSVDNVAQLEVQSKNAATDNAAAKSAERVVVWLGCESKLCRFCDDCESIRLQLFLFRNVVLFVKLSNNRGSPTQEKWYLKIRNDRRFHTSVLLKMPTESRIESSTLWK